MGVCRVGMPGFAPADPFPSIRIGDADGFRYCEINTVVCLTQFEFPSQPRSAEFGQNGTQCQVEFLTDLNRYSIVPLFS